MSDSEVSIVPTASAADVVVEPDVVKSHFDTVISTITAFKTQIGSLQQQLKVLEKTVSKEIKALRKEVNKKKQKVVNRKPSGFAKPTAISADLAAFMNKDEGAEVARTEVTRFIIAYIRENQLQNEDNRKIILPDEALTALLDVKAGEELTYFNLQKYMNRHFRKAGAGAVASTAAASAAV